MLNAKFNVLPPSVRSDSNWHVACDADVYVAHCFGFGHSIEGGEELARRIAGCLNACRGIATDDLASTSVNVK